MKLGIFEFPSQEGIFLYIRYVCVCIYIYSYTHIHACNFPDFIGKMKELKFLRLEGNPLQTLPWQLGDLENLQVCICILYVCMVICMYSNLADVAMAAWRFGEPTGVYV